MENKRKVGSDKEELVAAFLKKNGIDILERNFYFKGGEIDLVAKDKEYLVFVEVKYRSNGTFGVPEEAVTYAKQKKLVLGAKTYLYEHRLPFDTPCRFDVVSVRGEEFVWIENAFCLT